MIRPLSDTKNLAQLHVALINNAIFMDAALKQFGVVDAGNEVSAGQSIDQLHARDKDKYPLMRKWSRFRACLKVPWSLLC
jgi:hypothetical protein